MNGERRKHDASQCAWGSDITVIKTTLKILVDKIGKDTTHRAEVDDQQFALIREHTGQIGGLQSDVKHLDSKINTVRGNRAAAAVVPVAAGCPEPSFWQAIRKIKKYWFLFIFIGGGGLIALCADLLISIGTWLKQFVSTLG